MAGFNHFIIFGYNREGATSEDYDKFGEAIKKFDLELKLVGAPFGVSENRVILLKGPVTGYEKLIGDSETFSLLPMTGNRTITVYIPD